METIRDRFERVSERIYQSARSAGRDPSNVRLVVVTKLHPVSIVQEAIAAGACYLGENHAEEALEKKLALQDLSKEDGGAIDRPTQSSERSIHLSDIQWHIIGHVQSRKVHLVSEHFDYLHSLDSLKLARRLNTACGEIKRVLPVLLEINVSGEQAKSGWPAWDETNWAQLLPELQQIVTLPHIRVSGLMTIPPFFENPEEARPYFRRLRKFQSYLSRQIPQSDWQELSMGMSGDFEVAVQEGATWVRIGQAILGPRPE